MARVTRVRDVDWNEANRQAMQSALALTRPLDARAFVRADLAQDALGRLVLAL